MSELHTLQPAHELSLSSGEILTIKPLPFGKLAKALSLVSSIFGNASLGYEALSADANSAGAIIARVLAEGGEEIYQLLSLGTGKPREWFDTLSMDDGIRVTTLFLEVNSDFFIHQALPVLKASLSKVQGLKGMLG